MKKNLLAIKLVTILLALITIQPTKAVSISYPTDKDTLTSSEWYFFEWTVENALQSKFEISENIQFTNIIYTYTEPYQLSGTCYAYPNLDLVEPDKKYYWRVIEYIAAANDTSEIFSFTMANEAPYSNTQIVKPSNYQKNVPLKPVFAWHSVKGASMYHFDIRSYETDVLIYNQLLTDTILSLPDSLAYNKQYRAYIMPANAFGVDSSKRTSLNFYTSMHPDSLPETVSFAYMDYSVNPSLSIDNANGALRYLVNIYDSANFKNIIYQDTLKASSSSSTDFRIQDTFPYLKELYYRIYSIGLIKIDTSYFQSYFNTGNPISTYIYSPGYGSTSKKIQIKWNSIIGIDTFKVYIWYYNPAISDNDTIVKGQTIANLNEFVYANSLENASYFIKINSVYKGIEYEYGYDATVVLISSTGSAPDAPTISSPNTNVLVEGPFIDIYAYSTAASSMKVIIAKDSIFNQIVYEDSTVASEYSKYKQAKFLDSNKTYYIKAIALNDYGESVSDTIAFSTGNIIRIPQALSPKDAVPSRGFDIPFIWTKSQGINNYYLEIARYKRDSETAPEAIEVNDTTYVLPISKKLQPNTKYYWRVGIFNRNPNIENSLKTEIYSESLFYLSDWQMISTSLPNDTINADFIISRLNGENGNSINVNNTSIGAIKYFYYDFGDGNTSNTSNASHTYSKVGIYNICLTVIDITGKTSRSCKSIRVGESLPAVDFIYTIAGNTVQFNNSSVAGNYYWEFGDGNNSIVKDPEHTFIKKGIYNVCLTGLVATGEKSKKCQEIQISTGFIKSDFAYVYDQLKDSFYFRNLSLGNNISSYYWDFGNGVYSNNENVNTKLLAGTYQVCLSIKSDDKQFDKICKVIRNTADCFANFDYYVDTQNDSLIFSDLSIGAINNWFWEFGNEATSNMASPKIKLKPGETNVRLSVKDAAGCISSINKRVFVKGDTCSLKADFIYHVAPDSNYVWCINTSLSQNNYVSFWNFGDGKVSEKASPSYKYDQAGTYKVNLTVKNINNGCISKIEKELRIESACNAAFEYMAEGTIVNFKNASIGSTNKLNWIFGDGSYSNKPNPVHQYSNPGIYNVKLFVYNEAQNCMDTYEQRIIAGKVGNDIQSGFVWFSDLTSDSSIIFENRSSGNISKYFWDFGDGKNATSAYVRHKFADSGYYNVCLTVTDINDIRNTYCEVIKVGNTPDDCLTKFIYSIDSTSKTISLKDMSYGNPISWEWKVGIINPTDSSFDQNPVFTMPSNGYYAIRLKTINVNACKGEHLELINLSSNSDLKAIFMAQERENLSLLKIKEGPYSSSISNLEDSRLKSVSLSAAVYGDPTDFLWDFGDGNYNFSTLYPTHVYAQYGKYNVCLTVTDPVSGEQDTYCTEVEVKSLGTNNETIISEKISISVYPNPVQSNLNIEYTSISTEELQISIIALDGKTQMENKTVIANGKSTASYDISSLSNGLYILQIKHQSGVERIPVLKQ